MNSAVQPDVSVIVPVRNEQDCLAECLRSLGMQAGVSYEVIVVDDHSSDATREIAAGFPIQLVTADPLPAGWSGKCNAAWSGAKVAKGKWLLFTDADTTHASDSIATGVREAERFDAGLLSYSPKQEVHSFAERALMPVVFSELATCYPPQEVCDPSSAVAAANGQYLLMRRDVYAAIGGHAAVAGAILEDVELARRAKQAGYKLRFRMADVVSTRMYRSFGAMWEGWTKNLALLFPNPSRLAFSRLLEFGVIVACAAIAVLKGITGDTGIALIAALLAVARYAVFFSRIWRAHFDRLSNALAILGLPLFAILLLNSDISHRRGKVRWKGREYGKSADKGTAAITRRCIAKAETLPRSVN